MLISRPSSCRRHWHSRDRTRAHFRTAELPAPVGLDGSCTSVDGLLRARRWAAGSSNPIKMPMIVMTTSSSTKVKPRDCAEPASRMPLLVWRHMPDASVNADQGAQRNAPLKCILAAQPSVRRAQPLPTSSYKCRTSASRIPVYSGRNVTNGGDRRSWTARRQMTIIEGSPLSSREFASNVQRHAQLWFVSRHAVAPCAATRLVAATGVRTATDGR